MNIKLLYVIAASLLVFPVLTACSRPTSDTPPVVQAEETQTLLSSALSPEESNSDLQQAELIYEANTIQALFKKYDSVKQTITFHSGAWDNGAQTIEYAKLPDDSWASFIEEPGGVIKAAYKDVFFYQDERGPMKGAFINDGLFENSFSPYYAALFVQFPNADVISADKTEDAVTIVSEFPPSYHYENEVGITDGKIRCETVADARMLELISAREYHIAPDGSKRLIVEITYEYDYPFTEPEYAREWRELDKNAVERRVMNLIVDPGTPDEERYRYTAPMSLSFATCFNEPLDLYENPECTKVYVYSGDTPVEITLYAKRQP